MLKCTQQAGSDKCINVRSYDNTMNSREYQYTINLDHEESQIRKIMEEQKGIAININRIMESVIVIRGCV